jgi:hypothetical protein
MPINPIAAIEAPGPFSIVTGLQTTPLPLRFYLPEPTANVGLPDDPPQVKSKKRRQIANQ